MSREIAGREKVLVSLAERDGNVHLGWASGGIYDDNIICDSCEKLFKVSDDYAINFRRRAVQLGAPVSFPHSSIKFPSFDADAGLLHRFAITTLLRASFSCRAEHAQVCDSELESEVRPIILQGQDTFLTKRQVAVVVTKSPLAAMMASPVLHPVPGYPVYRLQMPHLALFVSATSAGLMPGFRDIALEQGRPVTVWRRREPMEYELTALRGRFHATWERTDRMLATRVRRA